MTRREIWMLTGIGLNTVASLTAIGLWALAPQRSAPLTCPPVQAAVSPPPRLAQLAPPPGSPPGRMARSAATRPDREAAVEAPERGNPLQLQQKQLGGVEASASVVALGERLNLNPQALALQLGDAHGEIPKPTADRLEQGFKRAEALARRLGLDESRTQSLVALTTYYVFSKLRAEKAVPGGVEPARAEALAESVLEDIRVTCGEDTAVQAKNELADL